MIKRFLKDSVLYTLAGLFTKGIGFIMLPIYLSYLSKAEFGLFDYLITIGMVVTVVITLELAQAVVRFVPESSHNTYVQRQYMSTALAFLLVGYLLLTLVVLVLKDPIAALVLDAPFNNSNILLWATLAYFSMSLMYITTVFQRAMLQSKQATIASAACAALTAVVSWVFLAQFKLGFYGVILGLIVGQLSIGVFNGGYQFRNIAAKPSLPILKEMLVFSWPLVFSSIGVIAATLVDKVMIKEMMTLADLGEYGVAARFASILTLVMVGIQSALAPLTYSNHNKPETRAKLRKLLKGYLLLGLLGVLALYFISPILIQILIGEGYEQVNILMPLLALAVVIQGAYAFFPGLSIVKKTSLLAILNVFVGFVNIGLNLALIPQYGLHGAAFSTLCSALLYFVLNAYCSEKYYPILNKR
ncbi:oligosaccharide flippase family protein [Pseudoalteromonas xiamenensis]|uniref:oligosaccharide flippase family protein n=1 Tax=Pseudoalteromonas xiamenensis TaxID=882626 RepID=UPI0035E758EA